MDGEELHKLPFIELKRVLISRGLDRARADACPDKAHLLHIAETLRVCDTGPTVQATSSKLSPFCTSHDQVPNKSTTKRPWLAKHES